MKTSILAITLLLAGCMSNSAIKRDSILVGEVAIGAAAVAIDVATPEQTTTTRTCSKDWRGNEICTTTTDRN